MRQPASNWRGTVSVNIDCSILSSVSFVVPLALRSSLVARHMFSSKSHAKTYGMNGRPACWAATLYSLATLRPSSESDWESSQVFVTHSGSEDSGIGRTYRYRQ